MELFLRSKHFSRRHLLGLYCFLSFVSFCAFYQYTSNYNRQLAVSDTSESLTTDPEDSMIHDYKFKAPLNLTIPIHLETVPNQRVGNFKLSSLLGDSIFNVTDKSSRKLVSSTGRRFSHTTLSYKTSRANKENRAISVHQPVTGQEAESPSSIAESGCSSSISKPKLILLWTPFFGSWEYMPSGPFVTCPSCPNCESTRDRSRLFESDAVIFHIRDMSLADLPVGRLPHQRWIFYCLESPQYSDFPGLQYMHQMFNWTMTYRSDSDIVTQYGLVRKIYPTKKLDLEALRKAWEKKTKPVVWMSSHCPTHGGRDAFVEQLRKFIEVDEFGTCGTMECPKDSTNKCLSDFETNYKFFLAFENSICADYITEKFFRTLKYNIVPVVFGGAKYQKFAPPGSYIDALSFKSPKHLAYFLTGVGRDFSLYSSYFQWRREYSVQMDNHKECDLCSLLHDKSAKASVYEDMREWWVGEGHCRIWPSEK